MKKIFFDLYHTNNETLNMSEKETCPKALENTHNKKHRVYTDHRQNSTIKKVTLTKLLILQFSM